MSLQLYRIEHKGEVTVRCTARRSLLFCRSQKFATTDHKRAVRPFVRMPDFDSNNTIENYRRWVELQGSRCRTE